MRLTSASCPRVIRGAVETACELIKNVFSVAQGKVHSPNSPPTPRINVPTTHVRLSNNQLVQCFLVSGEVLSFIYAGVAVLSEDYSGLILPAVVAIMFLLFPQARQWIETSSESSES